MIDVLDFVEWVERIAQRRLTYRIGGVGKDGTCDCIGLIMGAMYELGHAKYALHSTNYFARQQTVELKRGSGKELFIGQILYRARESTEKLNARYLPGRRYYTGDMLDYYHVGVVTSVNPLRIIECTQYSGVDGIVVRSSYQNWHYTGKLRDIDYSTAQGGTAVVEPELGGKEKQNMRYEARVITLKDPLSLRRTPGGERIGELPRDSIVQVIEDGEWAYVRYGDLSGYASMEYLERLEKNGNVRIRTILTDETGGTWEPVGVYSARTVIEEQGND